jgi:hypothetical protein
MRLRAVLFATTTILLGSSLGLPLRLLPRERQRPIPQQRLRESGPMPVSVWGMRSAKP